MSGRLMCCYGIACKCPLNTAFEGDLDILVKDARGCTSHLLGIGFINSTKTVNDEILEVRVEG
jgi:hypothetical protein